MKKFKNLIFCLSLSFGISSQALDLDNSNYSNKVQPMCCIDAFPFSLAQNFHKEDILGFWKSPQIPELIFHFEDMDELYENQSLLLEVFTLDGRVQYRGFSKLIGDRKQILNFVIKNTEINFGLFKSEDLKLSSFANGRFTLAAQLTNEIQVGSNKSNKFVMPNKFVLQKLISTRDR